MATRSACGGCSYCDVRGERRGWRSVLTSCLAGTSSCCTCLPSSSPQAAGVRPPAPASLPSTHKQGVICPDPVPPSTDPDPVPPSTPQASGVATAATALRQLPEITLEQLEAIIPLIEQEVDRLDPSAASSSSQAPISQSLSNVLAQWEEQKQTLTSFVRSLPTQLTDKVAGTGKSLIMPILTNALSGVGGVHWLGVGFTFIAWSLDNINNIIQNRADCIGILRRSLRLLQSTKEIWQATHTDITTRNEVLLDSVEKAFRCAIFCTSTLTDAWILRILKATTVKEAIAMLAVELDRANNQNIEFMGRQNLKNETLKVERQITLRTSNTVGGQEVMQDAVTYLQSRSDDIMAICLHGMGGIGKSTLGLKIFTEFRKSKYRDCRVELQFETNQMELCDIQKQILEKVCKHAISKFSNPTDGRCHMERELKQINDPIFLYVDNVQEHKYLTDLLPKASFFPKGSRILITSRGVYIKHGIDNLGITDYKLMEVKKLQEQQAQQLLWEQFERKGEHRDIISEVPESLEKRVLALCDGLPLALVVVGKYIANENGLEQVEVWRQVVDDMQKAESFLGSENDELYSRIMFSIQKLDQNVKRAFLDIIFLVDCPKRWLFGSWESTESWERIERLVSNKSLKVLCDRALVRRREFTESWESNKSLKVFLRRREFTSRYSTIEIHDVIKAMGKRMVENDKQELRISGMNKFEEHSNALKTVVVLDNVSVDASLLKQMPLLRLLIDVDVRGECQEIQLRQLRVVHGLRCSTTRLFDWSQCASLKEVAWGQQEDLNLCIFKGCAGKEDDAPNVSNLQEVFKHDKISTGLEVLALYGWSQLKDVDVIETLTCLKELRLCFCRELESLPQGISRLTGLNLLDLKGCASIQSLPDGLTSLSGLTQLQLGRCKSLQSISEVLTSLTGLTGLDLSGCGSLQSIPEGLTSLTDMAEACRAYERRSRADIARFKRVWNFAERTRGADELDRPDRAP